MKPTTWRREFQPSGYPSRFTYAVLNSRGIIRPEDEEKTDCFSCIHRVKGIPAKFETYMELLQH